MAYDIEYYQRNPVEWIEKFLEAKLWSKQCEILQAIVDHPKTSVRSGHGVGKSFVAACAAIWYLFTHPMSRVISTAPTSVQVRDILWQEIAKLHSNLERHATNTGHLTQVRLVLAKGWFAVGRSTDKPNAFIGPHAENLFVIFDEACGISRAMFDASRGVMTAEGNKELLIGNPTDPGTYFHETHTGEAPGYHSIKISVFDSPNMKNVDGQWVNNYDQFGKLPYPALTAMDWVNEMRNTYGEKSHFWTSKVLGEFPTTATDSLIDGRWLAAAVQKGIYLRKTLDYLEEGRIMVDSRLINEVVGIKLEGKEE